VSRLSVFVIPGASKASEPGISIPGSMLRIVPARR